MDKRSFLEEVASEMRIIMGDLLEIEVVNIPEIGLCISTSEPNSKVSSILGIKDFSLVMEKSPKEVAIELLKQRGIHASRFPKDFDFMKLIDIEYLKENLFINIDTIKELEKNDFPYLRFNDIGVHLEIRISKSLHEEGFIKLESKLIEIINKVNHTTNSDLFTIALKNKRDFEIKSIDDDLGDEFKMFYLLSSMLGFEFPQIYSLETNFSNHTSCCLFYPNSLEEISTRIGGNFTVLPFDNCICLIMKGKVIDLKLKEMLIDLINGAGKEVISKDLLYYNGKELVKIG